MKLTESLINALKPNIRLGLIDTELQEEHGIPEHIWQRWKRRGEEDRNKGLKTLYTKLLDGLGREEVVKQIENAIVKMALGEWEYVTTERYKDKSGKIIKTVEQTTTRPPNLKAAKLWLSYRAPERWSEHKKPGISSIGDIVPNPGSMTEEEWLQEYGNKQTNPTQPKEAEKQPVYTFNSTRTGADMTKLRKSLIKKLEAYIGRELGDTQLRKKHDIPEATWRRWKRRGATDRQNGLTTIYTMLLDRLWEGREEVVKQIENAIVERALGIRKRVSIRAWKDESGEIIGTVERTTTPPPNLKAAKRWLSYYDPERWGEHKKPGISSIGDIVPNPRSMTEEEWLQEYGNKQTNPTQPKEAEKQPEQREGVVKPIEYAVVERALGEWEYVTTERYKDESGKIIKTVEQTTTRPDFKAAKLLLSYLAPERWSEHKKPEITSIGAIIPDFGKITEDEWLQKYGNKQPEQKGKS